MSRSKSSIAWMALSVAMAILAIGNTVRIIGAELEWVDAITILALAWASGVFFGRGIAAKRAAAMLPPEIPGGPPSVPK